MQINTSWAVIFIDEPRLIDTCHLGASDRWENILIRRWESQTALRVKLTSSRVNASTKLSSFSANGKIWANPSSRVAGKVCEGERAAAAVAERHRRRPSRCFTRFPARVSVWEQWRAIQRPSKSPVPGIIFHKTLLKHLDPWSRRRTFVFRYSWRSCVLFALRGNF